MKSNLPQRFSCVCHRTFCIDVVSSVAELKIVFIFCLHRHRLKKSDAATPPPEYISLRPPITAPVSGGGDFTGLFAGGRFGVLALSEFHGSKFWQIWLCLIALGGSDRRWRVADCPAASFFVCRVEFRLTSLIGRSWSQRATWFSSHWPFLVKVDLGGVLFCWPRLLLLANSEFLRLQSLATGGLSGCVVIGFGRRNFGGTPIQRWRRRGVFLRVLLANRGFCISKFWRIWWWSNAGNWRCLCPGLVGLGRQRFLWH